MTLFGKNNSRGFTMVEIIIVVGIIAIMSALVLASVGKARARGRDAKRATDLKQLETALTLYYDNGPDTRVKVYPTTGGVWLSSEANDAGLGTGTSGAYIPGLAPNYIDALPRNPGGSKAVVDLTNCPANVKPSYRYKSDGISYKLLASCSPEGPLGGAGTPFYDSVRPSAAWMVCAGNTACTTW